VVGGGRRKGGKGREAQWSSKKAGVIDFALKHFPKQALKMFLTYI